VSKPAELIVWRHAHALDAEIGQDDMERELSDKGRQQAKKMAHWLEQKLAPDCLIFVSPSVRTLATIAPLQRPYTVTSELAPDSSVDRILKLIDWPNYSGQIMIVGHQPSLGDLVSQLMFNSVSKYAIRKACLNWIAQKNDAQDQIKTYIKAVMSPELL
jgi:phosphohistidine phosphatase